MFHLILFKNNSFKFFCQGPKWRCCFSRWLLCWTISYFLIEPESSWDENSKRSIWFSYFVDLRNQISRKLRAWILLKKLLKLSCQKSVSFRTWSGVRTINNISAPLTENISVWLRLFTFIVKLFNRFINFFWLYGKKNPKSQKFSRKTNFFHLRRKTDNFQKKWA